jgi:DNA-binding transcriptional LysR family regulator
MDTKELSSIDLNLLVSLDALLAESNVTRAAARLHISQPALSAQLARLRQLFGDPLLLPAESGRGMIATARALALRAPLRKALADLGAVLGSEAGFDPRTGQCTFQVALGDNATTVVGLPLIELLGGSAGPGVRMTMSMAEPGAAAALLESGEIDLLIDAQRAIPENAKMRVLPTQPFVMAQRKGHPRGTGTLDLETYLGLRHVVASPLRGPLHGYMDETLEQLGYRRNLVLSVPQFGMVPAVLEKSDYVSTLPAGLLAGYADRLDMFALPFEAPPFALAMAWHPRNHKEPGLEWLRELAARAAGISVAAQM